jgi:hypothetical protein
MKIHKWKIKLTDLRKIPENERVLFVLLGHLVNELNVLNKTFKLCSQFPEEPKWRTHAHTSQALVFARVLLGKMYEGWKLLEKGYFHSQLSRHYHDKLNEEAKEGLGKLKQYFGKGDNLIKEIRKKFAFHYSLEDVKSALGDELDEEELVIYLAETNGNTLFYFSEYIVNHALLEAIVKDDPEKALERLINESSKVVSWFTDVATGITAQIAEEYLLGSDGRPPLEPIELGSVPIAEQIEIPYFFTSDLSRGDQP